MVPGPGPEPAWPPPAARSPSSRRYGARPTVTSGSPCVVDDGSLRFSPAADTPTTQDVGDRGPTSPDVTIVISYEDAAAMSKGELAPAEALNAGRIRVRGDLSVLVAAQQMLRPPGPAPHGLVPSTTY